MGKRIVAASWWGTALLTLTAGAAVADQVARPLAAAVAIGLNVLGVGIFFWAYAVAVRRSRSDAIGIGGLFFLAGDVAPRPVRRSLLASLVAQVAVGLSTAAARPFTSLAFGVLAPLYGLALIGLWGAKHGRFGSRSEGRSG
ncbi:MAG: hypothetical protein KY454_07995 [Actinobacteria bacterium]|nr:hypothetical protein [Actinomycetota bacterium]MBW3650843.1 hypothetical protein [Actinomycetota bacterium]